MKKILILMVLGLAACKSDSVKIAANAAQPSSAAVTAPPAIPTEILLDIYENCDFIDIIFKDLPFSISQQDKPSIQQTIRYISNIPPVAFDPNCPYFAQLLFQENGDIVLDGKLFFQAGCTYYLFYEEGVAKYSGSLAPEGIKFYNNILAQAQKVRTNG